MGLLLCGGIPLAMLTGCGGCDVGEINQAEAKASLTPNVVNTVLFLGASRNLSATLRNDGAVPLRVASVSVSELDGPIRIVASIDDDTLGVEQETQINLQLETIGQVPGLGIALLEVEIDGLETLSLGITAQVNASIDCDDGNPCTFETFNPSTGECDRSQLPDNLACDDDDACTLDDRCLAGECFGERMRCDDGVECTVDSCDAQLGCVVTPIAERCSDENECTEDVCDEFFGCLNPPKEPGSICALNDCESIGFCILDECVLQPVPDGIPCSDGDACTAADTCRQGECTPGPEVAEGVTLPKFIDDDAYSFNLCDGPVFASRAENTALDCDSLFEFPQVPVEEVLDVFRRDDEAWVVWRTEPRGGDGVSCSGPGAVASSLNLQPQFPGEPDVPEEPPPIEQALPPECGAGIFVTHVSATPVVDPLAGVAIDLNFTTTTTMLSVVFGKSSVTIEDIANQTPPALQIHLAHTESGLRYNDANHFPQQVLHQETHSFIGAIWQGATRNRTTLPSEAEYEVGALAIATMGQLLRTLIIPNAPSCFFVCDPDPSGEIFLISQGQTEVTVDSVIGHFPTNEFLGTFDPKDVRMFPTGEVRFSSLAVDGARDLWTLDTLSPYSLRLLPTALIAAKVADVSFGADPRMMVMLTSTTEESASALPCYEDGTGGGCAEFRLRIVEVAEPAFADGPIDADAGVDDGGIVEESPPSPWLMTDLTHRGALSFASFRGANNEVGAVVLFGNEGRIRWSDDEGLHAIRLPNVSSPWVYNPHFSPTLSDDGILFTTVTDFNPSSSDVCVEGCGECNQNSEDPNCGIPAPAQRRRLGLSARGCGFFRNAEDQNEVCISNADCNENQVCDRVTSCVAQPVDSDDFILDPSCFGRCRIFSSPCELRDVDECVNADGQCVAYRRQTENGTVAECHPTSDCRPEDCDGNCASVPEVLGAPYLELEHRICDRTTLEVDGGQGFYDAGAFADSGTSLNQDGGASLEKDAGNVPQDAGLDVRDAGNGIDIGDAGPADSGTLLFDGGAFLDAGVDAG